MLFPDDLKDYDGYKGYYYSRKNWIFSLLALLFLTDVGDTLIKGRDYYEHLGPEYYPIRIASHVVLYLIAARSRKEWYHMVLVIVVLLYVCRGSSGNIWFNNRGLNISLTLAAFLCCHICPIMFLLRFFSATIALFLVVLPLYAWQKTDSLRYTKEAYHSFQRLLSDSSFSALRNNLGEAIKKEDKLTSALCLQQMGQICYHLTHFPQALDYHLQADKLFQELGPSLLYAENLNDIGAVFLHYKQPEHARRQYDEAFAMYRALRNGPGMALTHGKIGRWFIQQHRYDSGFYYQRLSLSEYIRLNDKGGMARCYGQMGNIYEDQQQYDSAFIYFKQSRGLSLQAGDTLANIEALNNMGDIYRKTGHYSDALPLTRSALMLSLRNNELFHLGSAYRDMAKTFHLMHVDDSAYYYQRIGQAYIQDIYSKENGVQLAILKTMYDVEKKNAEIGQLQATHRIAVAVVLIGILLLLSGMLVISRQRLRIRNAHLLNEQEKQAYLSQKAMMELQEQTLKQELELRSRELSSYTLNVMQKNRFLEELHKQLEEVLKEDRPQKKQLKQLQLQVQQNFNHDQHWEEFRSIFDQVHQAFFQKLKDRCDTLTRSELRILALLKMNLTSADMATLLGISEDSVRVMRYRLRKKLALQQSESLTMFIQSL